MDSVARAKELLAKASTLHSGIVNDVPQLRRGRVWCHECGATMKVDSSECLRSGWPKCCGYTMSIDSPEERRESQKGSHE